MSDNTVLEGLALRRAVAEAQGISGSSDEWLPMYEVDLNTIQGVELLPPDMIALESPNPFDDKKQWSARAIGVFPIYHDEPATAWFNVYLRLRAARKQEAESVK